MKTLYVNIDSEQIKSTDSYEVLNYNLLDDFFYYLGDAIVGDADIKVNKINLIRNFDNLENRSEFNHIKEQWEEFRTILLSDQPNGEYEILMPDGYFDWLRFNSNSLYQDIYKNCQCKNNIFIIDVGDFYEECMKKGLLRTIYTCVKKDGLDVNEIIIDIEKFQRSLFVKEAMSSLCLKIVGGKLYTLTLAEVKKNGYRNWINMEENIVYDSISFIENKLIRVKKDGKYGYILRDLIIPCVYDDVGWAKEGFIAVKKNKNWGYLNMLGSLLITFLYDDCRDFSGGFAAVKKNNKWGFINIHGDLAIPLMYDRVYSFSEGLAAVEKNAKWGFINVHGDLVIPLMYDDVFYFHKGWTAVKNNGKWGTIDSHGEIIISPIYDTLYGIGDGWCVASRYGKYGFIDASGREILHCVYDGYQRYNGGWVEFCLENKNKYTNKDNYKGCINTKENLLMPCIYDSIHWGDNGTFCVSKFYGDKYKYVNTQGNQILPFVYDYGWGFREGLAAVEKNGKWGYINIHGDLVIPLIYDDAYSFSEGLAAVKKNNKWGYINIHGDLVIPLMYDDAFYFEKGFARVKKDNMYGCINSCGTQIIPFLYDFIYDCRRLEMLKKYD